MLNLSPYEIFSQKDFYYTPSINISQVQLEQMVNHIKNTGIPYQNSGFEDEKEGGTFLDRQSWPIHLDNSFEMQHLFASIEDAAREANRKFNFDLDDLVHFVYMEYKDNSDTNLDWHIDITGGESNRRKLSFSFMVSDEDEYEGGELEIWLDPQKHQKIPKMSGGIAFFPSFLLHRVTKVTKGTRRVIVGMYGGRPYR